MKDPQAKGGPDCLQRKQHCRAELVRHCLDQEVAKSQGPGQGVTLVDSILQGTQSHHLEGQGSKTDRSPLRVCTSDWETQPYGQGASVQDELKHLAFHAYRGRGVSWMSGGPLSPAANPGPGPGGGGGKPEKGKGIPELPRSGGRWGWPAKWRCSKAGEGVRLHCSGRVRVPFPPFRRRIDGSNIGPSGSCVGLQAWNGVVSHWPAWW